MTEWPPPVCMKCTYPESDEMHTLPKDRKDPGMARWKAMGHHRYEAPPPPPPDDYERAFGGSV